MEPRSDISTPNTTIGRLRWEHEALAANAAAPYIEEYRSAHLTFKRPYGAAKLGTVACPYCTLLGWDDHEWHPLGD